MKRWSLLQIMIGLSRLSNPSKRRIVCCSIVLLPIKDRYCLGWSLRDNGQRRVPEPPDKITGITFIILVSPHTSYSPDVLVFSNTLAVFRILSLTIFHLLHQLLTNTLNHKLHVYPSHRLLFLLETTA